MRSKPVHLDPSEQFRLAVLATVAYLIAQLPLASRSALLVSMPALAAYREAAHAHMDVPENANAAQWSDALTKLVTQTPASPLGRMFQHGLISLHLHILLTLLMVEEDGELAEFVEPGGGFPTLGGLVALWRFERGTDNPAAVRDAVADLVDIGLVQSVAEEANRNAQGFHVPAPIAALLAGTRPRCEGMAYWPAGQVREQAWVPPSVDCPDPDAIAAALSAGTTRTLVLRGARHNGRKSFARKIANASKQAILEVAPALLADAKRWQTANALAVLGDAILVCEVDAAPGETIIIPDASWGNPLQIFVTAQSGAIAVARGRAQLAIELPLPDRAARARLWQTGGLSNLVPALSPMILPAGNIRRAAEGARAHAALDKRRAVDVPDVQQALRALRDARLDAIATRIDSQHEPDTIFLDRTTRDEFDALVAHCRQREMLAAGGGNMGVRALLSGPSGTGKTLAARHVARALGKDLFRVDLSATVNKYIGETEKALERVLSAAEELDIVLLLDEGDALMARRTDVGNSNDRYANLETNFLLQRIESFTGIILVTSNDAGRIDSAFARRMDAVLEFSPPDEVRRLDILVRQLGRDIAVGDRLLQDIACRCALTGGQLRNIATHARLLALDQPAVSGDAHLRRAVEREYRKTNSPCPLRRALSAVS